MASVIPEGDLTRFRIGIVGHGFVGQAVEYARSVNPDIEVLKLSAKTGEGLQDWKNWIIARTASIATESILISTIEGNHYHA
jgi:hypothetical protein